MTITPINQPTNAPTNPPANAPANAPTPQPYRLALSASLTDRFRFELPGWKIVVHDDPEAAFLNGEADAALAIDGAGELLWQEPIALAVPWTTWPEEISLENALAVQSGRHDVIVAVPWRELTPQQKALRVAGYAPTDPNYPLQTRLLLSDNSRSTHSLREMLLAQLPQNDTIHVAAVGDIMLDRALGAAILRGNVDFPFALVAEHLQRADISVGNVESALGSGGLPESKSYPFIAPPEAAVSLANAGFDIVSLANNHGMDYGPETLLEAIALLNQQHIATIGAGANDSVAHAPHIAIVNGLTIAFLGYVNVPVEYRGFDTERWTATKTSPGLAWGDPERIMADVAALATTVDLIVVVLHSGYEYVAEPSPPQTAAARAAIDAGADLVIGHHAHILQGVEFYNGGVIAYGLGNFAFEIDGDPETAVLDVWLDADGVHQIRFTPAIVQFGGQPRFATPAESTQILQTLYFLTDLLNKK